MASRTVPPKRTQTQRAQRAKVDPTDALALLPAHIRTWIDTKALFGSKQQVTSCLNKAFDEILAKGRLHEVYREAHGVRASCRAGSDREAAYTVNVDFGSDDDQADPQDPSCACTCKAAERALICKHSMALLLSAFDVTAPPSTAGGADGSGGGATVGGEGATAAAAGGGAAGGDQWQQHCHNDRLATGGRVGDDGGGGGGGGGGSGVTSTQAGSGTQAGLTQGTLLVPATRPGGRRMPTSLLPQAQRPATQQEAAGATGRVTQRQARSPASPTPTGNGGRGRGTAAAGGSSRTAGPAAAAAAEAAYDELRDGDGGFVPLTEEEVTRACLEEVIEAGQRENMQVQLAMQAGVLPWEVLPEGVCSHQVLRAVLAKQGH